MSHFFNDMCDAQWNPFREFSDAFEMWITTFVHDVEYKSKGAEMPIETDWRIDLLIRVLELSIQKDDFTHKHDVLTNKMQCMSMVIVIM